MDPEIKAKVDEFPKTRGARELSMDEMDKVSGGVISDETAGFLDAFIAHEKKTNHKKEDLIYFILNGMAFNSNPLLRNNTREEVAAYVEAHW